MTINIDGESIKYALNSLGHRLTYVNTTDILFVILALAVPPLAVLLKFGFGDVFWVNVILTILGFVPGQIHAFWAVLFLK